MSTILIIDVATAGFSPERDPILEVACILLDAGTAEVLDTTSVVVKHPPDSIKAPDFHAALLHECYTSRNAVTLKQLEAFLLAGPWTTATAVCNRALDFFDMKFLRKQMPEFARAIERKLQIELKALEFLGLANGTKAPFTPSGPRTYRAPDDAIYAYEELLYWCTP